MKGVEIGHATPWADPGERNAIVLSLDPTPYSAIFTPAYVKQVCGR
jgi:hypothetical protein